MNKFYIVLFLLTVNLTFSQRSIFNNKLNSEDLPMHKKLSLVYASTFSQIDYYEQSGFDLFQDLKFTLPNGKQIIALLDKSYFYKNGSFSGCYKILNEPNSELVFSKYNDALTGMYISQNLEKVVFTQTSSNIIAVSYVDEIKLIEEELNAPCYVIDENENNSRGIDHANICLENSTCSGNSTIDLMFVYTLAAKNAWGGVNTVNSNLASVVSNLNQSMTLSGITGVNFNIVHTYEMIYTESGNQQTDLTRLRTMNDGFMDEIHDLRDTYGADLVAMINGDTGGGCGIGNLNTSTTNYNDSAAFSVTRFGCAMGNLTVAHEMGHNMGLRHDWFVDSGETPCSHHHGYINQSAINLGTSSSVGQRWRTIMAYNNQCSAAGISCTRQNRWSNPDLAFNGEPMGVSIGDVEPSDEAYAFRRMACIVADFKSPLSVNQFSDLAAVLYPNPVKDQLFIDLNVDDLSFEIFNLSGQILLKTKEKTITLSHLKSGVYFVKISSETLSESKMYKFIKE